MELTVDHLKQLLPKNICVDEWYNALTEFFPNYEINTPCRIAAFIAQCSHESAEFTVIEENLNYRAVTLCKVFPKYFPDDAIANKYASLPNKREAIANRVYANRMGNGSEESGDGYRYRGRGLIQLTGKQNYTRFAASANITVDEAVKYLQTFKGATHSACWFWNINNLNQLADVGDIVALTKKINGGTIGLDDRIKHYEHALHVLES